MPDNKVPKLKFNKIQIGIMVNDLEKAVKHFESLGIGPFKDLDRTVVDRYMYGQPVPPPPPGTKSHAKIADMGIVEFEVIQPSSKANHGGQFLEAKGEGIEHIAFFVDNLKQMKEQYEKMGYQAANEGKFAEDKDSGYALFDTSKIGGMKLEIQRLPKK